MQIKQLTNFLKDNKATIFIGTELIGGATSAIGGTMTYIGFTSSGIAANSVAAAMQAQLGNVVAGSAFSAAQSLGALGVFNGLAIGGGVIVIVGAGGYIVYKNYYKPKL